MKKNTQIIWWHFIPAAIHFIWMGLILAIEGERHHEMVISGQFIMPIHFVLITSLTHNIIYWLACLKVVRTYKNEINNDVSYQPQLNYFYHLLTLTGHLFSGLVSK